MNRTVGSRVRSFFDLRFPAVHPVNNLRDFIRALARSRFGKTTSHQPSARRTDGSTLRVLDDVPHRATGNEHA